MHLAGALPVAAEQRVVITLDADAALIARHLQDGENLPPVRIAKAGETGNNRVIPAHEALGRKHVAVHRRVLAVHMEHLARVSAQVRDRVDQLRDLVRGLPFESQRVRRHRVKHHVPRARVKADVAGVVPPRAAHRTVLNGDAHAPVLGAARQLSEHLFEARHGLVHRLALIRAREGRYRVRAEIARRVDALAQRVKVALLLQRVAIKAQRGDLHVLFLAERLYARRHLAQVRVLQRHMEVHREALKALPGQRRRPVKKRVSGNAGSDGNLIHDLFSPSGHISV